jgi:hypothetical protein
MNGENPTKTSIGVQRPSGRLIRGFGLAVKDIWELSSFRLNGGGRVMGTRERREGIGGLAGA